MSSTIYDNERLHEKYHDVHTLEKKNKKSQDRNRSMNTEKNSEAQLSYGSQSYNKEDCDFTRVTSTPPQLPESKYACSLTSDKAVKYGSSSPPPTESESLLEPILPAFSITETPPPYNASDATSQTAVAVTERLSKSYKAHKAIEMLKKHTTDNYDYKDLATAGWHGYIAAKDTFILQEKKNKQTLAKDNVVILTHAAKAAFVGGKQVKRTLDAAKERKKAEDGKS